LVPIISSCCHRNVSDVIERARWRFGLRENVSSVVGVARTGFLPPTPERSFGASPSDRPQKFPP
jgi:hypothetical protein